MQLQAIFQRLEGGASQVSCQARLLYQILFLDLGVFEKIGLGVCSTRPVRFPDRLVSVVYIGVDCFCCPLICTCNLNHRETCK